MEDGTHNIVQLRQCGDVIAGPRVEINREEPWYSERKARMICTIELSGAQAWDAMRGMLDASRYGVPAEAAISLSGTTLIFEWQPSLNEGRGL